MVEIRKKEYWVPSKHEEENNTEEGESTSRGLVSTRRMEEGPT